MRYKTEIIEIIKPFEAARIPHEFCWLDEHLTIAIQNGILELNEFRGVVTTNLRVNQQKQVVLFISPYLEKKYFQNVFSSK